jgi:anti-anti-sigma factor
MLTINHNSEKSLLTFVFSGRMDTIECLKTGEMITAKMTETLASIPPGDPSALSVVFDLEGVSYISSSFIRICVQTAKQTPPGKFSITGSDPFVKKTFKIAGLDEILNIR